MKAAALRLPVLGVILAMAITTSSSGGGAYKEFHRWRVA